MKEAAARKRFERARKAIQQKKGELMMKSEHNSFPYNDTE